MFSGCAKDSTYRRIWGILRDSNNVKTVASAVVDEVRAVNAHVLHSGRQGREQRCCCRQGSLCLHCVVIFDAEEK